MALKPACQFFLEKAAFGSSICSAQHIFMCPAWCIAEREARPVCLLCSGGACSAVRWAAGEGCTEVPQCPGEKPGCGVFSCALFLLLRLSLHLPSYMSCWGARCSVFVGKGRGRGRTALVYQKVPRVFKLCSPLHYLLCLVTFPQLNRDCRAFISN